MKFVALAFALLLGIPAHAQQIPRAWINVSDPVLQPNGDHVIARQYLIWDGRQYCKPNTKARLVVVFHGGNMSAEAMAGWFRPRSCYVVVYPSGSNMINGVVRVSGEMLMWNASSEVEYGWPGVAGVNDDRFITALVSMLKTNYGITTAFAVGASKGGMMAFHYACDTTMFAAIATVATTISDATCWPAVHIPNLHIHGTADTVVCWTVWYNSCNPWPPAQPRVVGFWEASGTGHTLVALDGGIHAWRPTPDFDTSAKIWAFLDAR